MQPGGAGTQSDGDKASLGGIKVAHGERIEGNQTPEIANEQAESCDVPLNTGLRFDLSISTMIFQIRSSFRT